jgi:hypothetical protein
MGVSRHILERHSNWYISSAMILAAEHSVTSVDRGLGTDGQVDGG